MRHQSTAVGPKPEGGETGYGPLIDLQGIDKTFTGRAGRVDVLRDVNLTVRTGEFVVIVGPSGCGKSTILNLLSGLSPQTSGRASYSGQDVPCPNTRVGYITQKDNLLLWRSVAKNIALPLEIRGIRGAEAKNRVHEMIGVVGLEGFEDAYPHELSGGMRKRVTLARTLVYSPETLLADEPFGALDAQLRLVMQSELLRIWSQTRCTVVFVTHDLEEAITLADRVVLFSKRPATKKMERVIDLPRPRDVYKLRFQPEFMAIYQELWAGLAEDLEGGE